MTDRRSVLQMMIAAAASGAMPGAITRALAIPANNRTGTIKDVEHIVILMQENRSFDHYLGTLAGVRGFNDTRVARLANGAPVWQQPSGDGTLMPFHPSRENLGLQFIEDLPHGWTDTHAAVNGGRFDGWVAAKGTTTMAHLARADIPFHYALADAFTVCDAYHASLLGPTDPNRYHMWTGWVGNDGSGGGPVVDNAEAGYSWSTFPERLQAAGISWKIYQDIGLGLDAKGEWGWTENAYIGNYGDNSLLYFDQYRDAARGTPLYHRARTGTHITRDGTLFDEFAADVTAGTLPRVSWIVAPEAFTEHPNWPANYGAWYVSQMLEILTRNPEVFSKTALFLTYDENDGFFDHMVPPLPPTSDADGGSTVTTLNEIFPGSADYAPGPYGLGVRVPMIVISPWSRGGFVNSQVFDHTSLIRFIEARFAADHPEIVEPNITAWRRAVSGDLTSCFDFETPNNRRVTLPSTTGYAPPDGHRHHSYVPALPAHQHMPRQEPGQRPARPLPYALAVTDSLDAAAELVTLTFANEGTQTAVFQVRSANPAEPPRAYTVEPGKSLDGQWSAADGYDLELYGPNGFFRAIAGTIPGGGAATLVVALTADPSAPSVTVSVGNPGAEAATVSLFDHYAGQTVRETVPAGGQIALTYPLAETACWYDVAVRGSGTVRRLAGHVETGAPSLTDPAMA